MKKLTPLVLLSTLMMNAICIPATVVFAQENLSPIESVTFTQDNNNEENDTQANTEQTQEQTQTDQENHDAPDKQSDKKDDKNEENKEESAKDKHKDITPEAFIDSIEEGLPHSHGQHVMFQIKDGKTESSQRFYSRDEDYYSIEDFGLDYLPYSVFLKVKQGKIESAYLSVDNMIEFANRILEENPGAKDTSIEKFSKYAKDHQEDLQGKAVEIEAESPSNRRAYSIVELNDLLIQVTKEWIQEEAVSKKMQTLDYGVAFELDEETGPLFENLINKYKENYPDINPILDLFKDGYRGTISFAYDKQEIGFGLVTSTDKENTKGIEHYVTLAPIQIALPAEDHILSRDAFQSLIGFNYLDDLDKIDQEAAKASE